MNQPEDRAIVVAAVLLLAACLCAAVIAALGLLPDLLGAASPVAQHMTERA